MKLLYWLPMLVLSTYVQANACNLKTRLQVKNSIIVTLEQSLNISGVLGNTHIVDDLIGDEGAFGGSFYSEVAMTLGTELSNQFCYNKLIRFCTIESTVSEFSDCVARANGILK